MAQNPPVLQITPITTMALSAFTEQKSDQIFCANRLSIFSLIFKNDSK